MDYLSRFKRVLGLAVYLNIKLLLMRIVITQHILHDVFD